MLCHICKEKTATVHLTQIAGDKLHKIDLCEACAKEKGVNDPAGFSLADLLLGLGASQELEQATGSATVKCPKCGFTQGDFKKTGRLGCPQCYQTFASGLEMLIESTQKRTQHRGKVPERLRAQRSFEMQQATLRKKLEAAIEAEDFELAAQLRDEIKQLKAPPVTAPAK
ncbi:MAG TPA: UvrB/UvrC motif-containing protein [Verrucomicrobiota bacterium]|nr:UvrB/UvrC motif-containing protein [Verrucomicrobiota bacterium]HNT14595.1 UvrB/UvrC motif-containing protein [Verrucomicrobiota bacterium]